MGLPLRLSGNRSHERQLQNAFDVTGGLRGELHRSPAAGNPLVNITGSPIICRQRIRPASVSPQQPSQISAPEQYIFMHIERSPPPTSNAAAALTCIGPCGPLRSSNRHMRKSVPYLDSTPCTASAMRSNSSLPAKLNRSAENASRDVAPPRNMPDFGRASSPPDGPSGSNRLDYSTEDSNLLPAPAAERQYLTSHLDGSELAPRTTLTGVCCPR